MIKVSVIIPCYNASKYIDYNFKILFNDKLKDIEVIAINDGSIDNTLEILNNYKKTYKNLIVIAEKNSGQAVARNKGLKKASGEYIMFLDIDDYLAKDAIFKMYNKAKESNSDYLYTDYYAHYETHDKLYKNYYTNDEDKNAILTNYAPWGKLIKKDLIEKIDFKFYEGHIFEDIAVIPFLGASSKNPIYLEEPLYFYNQTNISTTRTKEYNKKYEDIFAVSDYIYEEFKKNNLLDKYYDELEFVFINGILRSNVMIFAKYKDGLNNIKLLRKNVLAKFPKLLKNKYLKQEKFKNRLLTYITLYFPKRIIYLIQKVRKQG